MFTTHLCPFLNPRSHSCVDKQASGSSNEDKDYSLILGRITLEAGREDILLFSILANGKIIRQAGGFVALAAGATSLLWV